eukprot:scaffold5517_cov116-Isochrysis_galbana.AAC.5
MTPSQSKMNTSTCSSSSEGTSSFLHRPAPLKETAAELACSDASEVAAAPIVVVPRAMPGMEPSE